MRVYLDHAATTPLSEEVLETMLPYFREHHGNPSSIHADGRKARTAIEDARKIVADCLDASLGEIFFTSGGTESNNMALFGAMRDLGVQRVISSQLEHHCVLHTLEELDKQGNIQLDFVKTDGRGRVDVAHLEKLLKDKTKKTLVSLMYANNEIGTLLEVEKVSALCKVNDALFHSDTVQAVGQFPINVQETYFSFLTGSAHKFHGPKGVGFIYINGDNIIKPYIFGGSQERNMRAGTENIAGITGLATAFQLAHTHMNERKAHIEEIRSYFIDQLQSNFSDIQFNGDYDRKYLHKVLSVSFPPTPKTDLIVFSLDIAGISASGGSACSSGVESASHVLAALQPDDERKTVRFSFSHYNTKAEIDFTIEKLKTIVVSSGG